MIIAALHQALVLLVAALVLLAPGWLVIAATRVDAMIDPLLRPAAAIMTTFLISGVVLAVTLGIGAPIAYNLIATGVIVAAALIACRARILNSARRWSITRVRRPGWSRPAWFTAAATAFAALSAAIAGGYMDHDQLYHAAVSLKLQDLAHPTFASTQRFIDGGVNPAYALPAWHEVVAQISWLSHSTPLTVIWLLPAVFSPVYVLACAGLARTLHRTTWIGGALAAPVAAWLLLAIEVLPTGPYLPMEAYGMIPGEIVFYALLPLLGALLVEAMEVTREPRARRGILIVTVATLLTIGVLHANYLAYAGMLLIGYLVARCTSLPWPRLDLLRVVRTSAVWLVSIAATIALMLPVLAKLAHFGRGGGDETGSDVLDRFGPMMRGNASSFHLDSGILLHFGGLSILAIACIALLFTVRDTPALWYLLGATLPILVVSQSDLLFGLLVGSGSTTVGIRMNRALPLTQLLVVGVFVAAWIAQPIATELQRVRLALVAIVVAVLGVAVSLLWPIGGTGLLFITSHDRYPGIVATLAMYAGLVIAVVLVLRRWIGRGRSWAMPVLASATVVTLLTGVLVASSLTEGRHTAGKLVRDLRNRPATADGVDRLRTYPPDVIAALRSLPTGDVVLASPKISYDMLAIAPVYVVGDFKVWQADTPANDTKARLKDVASFLADDTTTDERKRILRDRDVDVIVLQRAGAGNIVQWVLDHPELFVRDAKSQPGSKLILWHVRRKALT